MNHRVSPLLKTLNGAGFKNLLTARPEENRMPWYAWLILVVAIGSIVGGLMMLRDTANKVDLTEEQRKRIAERNAEMDAKEDQDR